MKIPFKMKTKDCKSKATMVLAAWGKFLELYSAYAYKNFCSKKLLNEYEKKDAKKDLGDLEKSAKKIKDDAKEFDKFIVSVSSKEKNKEKKEALLNNPKEIASSDSQNEQRKYEEFFRKIESDYKDIKTQMEKEKMGKYYKKHFPTPKTKYVRLCGLVPEAMDMLDKEAKPKDNSYYEDIGKVFYDYDLS